jgi:hypothetical protein
MSPGSRHRWLEAVSDPAMAGLGAGSLSGEPGVDGGRHEQGVHDYHHLTPAPRVRAIVARSDNATVKRARIAFTTPPRW